jgi:WD40 repeat protein
MNCVKILIGHNAAISQLLELKNGSIVSNGNKDKTIRIWSKSDYICTHILKTHTATINMLILLDNGSLLSSWMIKQSDYGMLTMTLNVPVFLKTTNQG